MAVCRLSVDSRWTVVRKREEREEREERERRNGGGVHETAKRREMHARHEEMWPITLTLNMRAYIAAFPVDLILLLF